MVTKTEQIVLPQLLSEFREALEDEIIEIEKGKTSTILKNGRKIENSLGFWYRFFVDYMPDLPADTPCKLKIGQDEYNVTVVSVEDDSIVLMCENKLPESIGFATLDNGSAVLMKLMISRIEKNAQVENRIAERLIPDVNTARILPYSTIESYSDLIFPELSTEKQKEAIISALTNDTTFIWGPPGTGKTSVISGIISELFRHDRSVLIVSHTNTAVDGALKKAIIEYEKTNINSENFPFLRIGTMSEALPKKARIEFHIEKESSALHKRERDALEKRKNADDELRKLNDQKMKLIWLGRQRIRQLKGESDEISKESIETQKLGDELKKEEEILSQLLYNYPEVKDLEIKQNHLSKLIDKERKVEELIREKNASIENFSTQLRSDRDEIAKHSVYKEIENKLSSLMSEDFLQQKIGEQNAILVPLVEKKTNLIIQKQAKEKYLRDYEAKNSIAKFFRKNDAEEAIKALQEIEQTVQGVEQQITLTRKMIDNYNLQLLNVQSLKKELLAVKPSYSEQYWIDETSRLSELIDTYKKQVFLFERERNEIKEEIGLLSKTIEELGAINVDYSKQMNKVAAICSLLSKKQDDLDRRVSEFEKNVKREVLCCQYYSIDFDFLGSSKQLLSGLISTLEKVSIDYDSINMDTVENAIAYQNSILNECASELIEIRKALEVVRLSIIKNARIIGTTLTTAYINDDIQSRKFDTVILDEASMASIPALWCTTLLANRNIIIVGDFLQLSPIVLAKTDVAKKWLGKDIFYHSGMMDAAKSKNPERNFIMLQDQFRMEKGIADISSTLYYGRYGGLVSANKDNSSFYSWYNGNDGKEGVVLLDTESLHAWATGVPQANGRHSRYNLFSAVLDVELAFNLIRKKLPNEEATCKTTDNPLVLIIAPYKPQAMRIKELVNHEYKKRGLPQDAGFIRSGTVHSFQGSEAPIVIFDMVLDEPHFKAGLFNPMPNKDADNYKEMLEYNEQQERMFNVAATRAQYKLIVVADFKFCNKAKNNAMSMFLDYILNKNYPRFDAKELFPQLAIAQSSLYSGNISYEGNTTIVRDIDFDTYFIEDLKSFKSQMIIYSPFMTNDRISKLLPLLSYETSMGKQIIVVTKAIKDRESGTRYLQMEGALKAHGIKVIHKKDMHEKLIIVDGRILWTGSLNTFSFTGNTGEIMTRFDSKEIADAHIKALGISSIVEVAEDDRSQYCPLCGGNMVICESNNGGIYWSCANKDYKRKPEQKHAVDGLIRCPDCNEPMTFKMKTQPRWYCSANTKHHSQIIRISDLQFEPMLKTIPREEMKYVVKYFKDDRGASLTEHEKEILAHARTSAQSVGKEVWQYSMDGALLQVYPSIKSASAATGISESCIRDAANGKQKSSKGFKWAFAEEQ